MVPPTQSLRRAPSTVLIHGFDEILRETLQSLLNVDLKDLSWTQAVLPVSAGGLGVRRSVDIALSCYLGSLAEVKKLVVAIGASSTESWITDSTQAALANFRDQWNSVPEYITQRSLDRIVVSRLQRDLESQIPDSSRRAV